MRTAITRDHFLNLVSEYLIRDNVCVEIGVLNGDFSERILQKLNPKKLILIDPFTTNEENKYSDGTPTAYSTEENYNNVISRFEKEIISGQIIVIKQYSHLAFTDPVNDDFEKAITGKCDFIYLDGSHLYEDVKRDLEDCMPKLNTYGLLCGHDYITHEDFGVKQAVNEFMKEHNFELIILNEQGGDFALRRI
jgi:hypothetical protein